MVQFVANTVLVDYSDNELIAVEFANKQGGVFYEALQFLRYLVRDERDVDASINNVYARRRRHAQGGYGGVERVELHPERMRVVVGGEVAERMGDREFEIALAVPSKKFESLRAGLRKVFAGLDTLKEYPD
jgi:hypothetical protein